MNVPSTTEQTYFSESGVTVTNARLVVHGHTYALRNLVSVAVARISPRRFWPFSFLVGGGVLFLVGMGPNPVIAPGLVVAAIGVIILCFQRSIYAVALSTAAGEIRAVKCRRPDFAQRVVEAINSAIIAGH